MPPIRRTPRDRNRALLDMVFGFKENVPLKRFIQDTTNREEETFTLAEILEAIKNYISAGRLFDENNPSIIMCSDVLERVFNQKALHVLEVRDIVMSQLEPRQEQPKDRNQMNQTTTTTSTATLTTIFQDTPRYELRNPLREVFQTMDEFDQTKMIFPYDEITALLSAYILKHRDRLFDLRNIKVALVENDPLGQAFKVKAFHRCQLHTLLRTQLVPIHPRTLTVMTSDNDDLAISTMRLRYMDIQDAEEE